MEQATRIIEWNVSGGMLLFLYVGSFSAIAFSAYRLIGRALVWRKGRRGEVPPTLSSALNNLTAWAFGSRKMARDPYAAWMHHFILWGFVILFIGTTLVFLEKQTPLHFFYGTFYVIASCVIDLGGLAFVIGLVMAIHRRYVRRAERLRKSPMAGLMLFSMLAIAASGFLLEAARIGVDLPSFEIASVVGYPLALLLRAVGLDAESLTVLHRLLWLGHAALCVAFFGLLSAYLFKHAIVSTLAVALSTPRPTGKLRPYPAPANGSVGAARVSDFLQKDLLDGDACTTCGRCTSVCPAAAAGKALDPRAVVLGLSSLVGRATKDAESSAFDAIDVQAIWECTTCGACNFECPIHIPVFDKIIDLRRQLVDRGEVSPAAQSALEGIGSRHNPWSYPPAKRGEWRDGGAQLPVINGKSPNGAAPEWVYWVGCAGAFEPTAQSISRSTAAILKKAGVDFAVLAGETCTGDPARRLGEEGMFERVRKTNLERIRATGAKKIVTHCPHCLNSLKNEYPEDGAAELEIVHHSQLIKRLIADRKVALLDRGTKETITFHDPCYLGRHNGEYDAPRSVVESVPGMNLVEMPRAKERSFCCGGGGGQMWLESSGTNRIEGLRLAEAEKTGASLVATGCPFCKVMLESAAATAGSDTGVRIRDLSEIVLDSMEA
jgi:Fe-S oxidoreductase/nitrate reductase gamma subunit